MPQDFCRRCEIGQATGMRRRNVNHVACARAALLRAGFGVAFVGLVSLNCNVALAGGDDDADQSFMSKFMQTIGLRPSAVSTGGIQYTERSPLVVPPTRDLPSPAAGPLPAPDWPQQSADKHHKQSKAKLPPATPPQSNPNPPFEKKTWYNPFSWFNKEEYAPFPGEPVRENLTDPPMGYRTPSPDQPYGIGPEKQKEAKGATAAGRNLTPVGGGH